MKRKLQRIMHDITSLDPGLKGRQTEKLVGLFLKAKPRADMDRRFKHNLRTRLFGEKREQGGAVLILTQLSGFFKWLFNRRIQLAAAASVLSVLLIAMVAFLPLLVTFQQKSPAGGDQGFIVKQNTDTGQPIGTIEQEPSLLPSPDHTAEKPLQPEGTADKKSRAPAKEPTITEQTPGTGSEAGEKPRAKTTSAEEAEKLRDLAAPGLDEISGMDELKHTEKIKSLQKEESSSVKTIPGENAEPSEKGFLPAAGLGYSLLYTNGNTSSYAEIRSYLERGVLPPPETIRIRELINYFDYNYPQPTDDKPFTIFTELAQCPWNPSHKLLYIGIRDTASATRHRLPVNLVFLLNLSGSMNRPGKLPLLKQAMRGLAAKLDPADRISIIGYAGRASLVLPPSGAGQYNTILQAIDTLRAGGVNADGTGLEQAYDLATGLFKENNTNKVILATDTNLDTAYRIIHQKAGRGMLFTVLDFSPQNRKGLRPAESIDNTGVTHAYIDSLGTAQKALFPELTGASYSIQSRFNPDRVRSYRILTNDNRPAEEGGLDATTEQAESGREFTVLYEIILEQPRSETSSPEILSIRIGNQEQSVETVVPEADTPYTHASSNFRLATAAAEWGLLLGKSHYKGNATYKQLLELARDAVGPDPGVTESEFLRLIRISQELSGEP